MTRQQLLDSLGKVYNLEELQRKTRKRKTLSIQELKKKAKKIQTDRIAASQSKGTKQAKILRKRAKRLKKLTRQIAKSL